MVTFFIVLFYLALFVPLIVNIARAATEKEVSSRRWKFSAWFAVIGILVFSFILRAGRIWTEVLWFQIQNYQSVYLTRFFTKTALFFGFGLLSAFFLFLNARIAKKLCPSLPSSYEHDSYYDTNWRTQTTGIYWVEWVVISLVGFGMGVWAACEWKKVLMWLKQAVATGTDPIFNKGIGFYLFDLPVLRFISDWFMTLTILSLIGVGLLYLFYGLRASNTLSTKEEKLVINRGLSHGILLGIGFFSIMIWKCFLAIYGRLYSSGGTVFGAGFTDVHAKIPMYYVFMGLTILLCIFMLVNVFSKIRKRISWGAWVAVSSIWLVGGALICLVIIPAIIQKVRVENFEQDRERSYIEHNIEFTNRAFDLKKVESKDFEARSELTWKDIKTNRETVDNIRLFDWRALQDTLKNLQEIRLYYEFDEVDIDRYVVNGKYRQIMLALREISADQLPNKTWVNQHLMYTHGCGLCLGVVNQFLPEGLPKLVVKNIPPASSAPELNITESDIYYGEQESKHIFVNAAIEEFDYPTGEDEAGKENEYTKYTGRDGIRLGKGLRSFFLALRFDDLKQLTSDYLNSESRVIFHRQIKERVKVIAPFLKYDKDPYPVIREDGSIFWLWDAYTTSDMYPYSEAYREDENTKYNYIRNSVKVTIDAYNGNVIFYIYDENDPLINTWKKVFPVIFKSKDEMPEDLKKHIRYPEDFFLIQARMFRRYHMLNPEIFYQNEDFWNIAQEKYRGEAQEVLPYYVIIRLPGEEKEEFLQMIPFTPKDKKVMIAWIAARCDAENYGKLIVYKFPKQKQIYGPMQIENRIDQDPELSKALTLWGQGGSEVIRANTLVIPIEDSLIYVEPIYLKASEEGGGKTLPEIKLVVVAMGDRLAWAPTFEDALRKLFIEAPVSSQEKPEEFVKTEGTSDELVEAAQRHFNQYQKLMGEGRFTEAGQELKALEKVLAELASRKK